MYICPLKYQRADFFIDGVIAGKAQAGTEERRVRTRKEWWIWNRERS